MTFITITVCYDNMIYDTLCVLRNGVIFYNFCDRNLENFTDLQKNQCYERKYKRGGKKKYLLIYFDGILTHFIIQELLRSPTYRKKFIETVENVAKGSTNLVLIHLKEPERYVLDYAWNYRTTYLIRERLELDHTLSWLSTLGGAFSALGDYFTNYALIAGKISFHQLKLALRLGDPNIAARCRLYLSLSLIQQGHLGRARKIIQKEYNDAKNAVVKDQRLIRMCLGIWSKLKYEYVRRKTFR